MSLEMKKVESQEAKVDTAKVEKNNIADEIAELKDRIMRQKDFKNETEKAAQIDGANAGMKLTLEGFGEFPDVASYEKALEKDIANKELLASVFEKGGLFDTADKLS